ncbi:MAG TPA: hypothetical protein VFB28_09505 [Terriglobales bacterium]|nr:hypothetical protein [Terriglobales bacterium]
MKRVGQLAAFLLLCVFAFPQIADVVPADNLVVEGVPKIPSTLAEQVDRYNNYRGTTIDSWDPLKREMLISTRFGDTTQIHRVTMPGGARTQLTFYPDRVSLAQFSHTKNDSFIFSKDVGGGEFFQIYRYDLATSDVTLLTDGKSRNTDPVWSYAGDKIAYGSTRRTGDDVDLWEMDPANPKSDHMLAQLQGGGWGALDWSPDGQKILAQEEISANESYLWLVDSSTGEKTLITPKGGNEKIAYSSAWPISISPANNTVI